MALLWPGPAANAMAAQGLGTTSAVPRGVSQAQHTAPQAHDLNCPLLLGGAVSSLGLPQHSQQLSLLSVQSLKGLLPGLDLQLQLLHLLAPG